MIGILRTKLYAGGRVWGVSYLPVDSTWES